MPEHRWTSPDTEEFVRWLIEDVVGAEFVNTIRTSEDSMDVDTPTHTLGETIRQAFVDVMPIPPDPAWLDRIDWNQVAQYLIQHPPDD